MKVNDPITLSIKQSSKFEFEIQACLLFSNCVEVKLKFLFKSQGKTLAAMLYAKKSTGAYETECIQIKGKQYGRGKSKESEISNWKNEKAENKLKLLKLNCEESAG